MWLEYSLLLLGAQCQIPAACGWKEQSFSVLCLWSAAAWPLYWRSVTWKGQALPLWGTAGCAGNVTGLMLAPALLRISLDLLDNSSGTLLPHFNPTGGLCCCVYSSLFPLPSTQKHGFVFFFFGLGKAALGENLGKRGCAMCDKWGQSWLCFAVTSTEERSCSSWNKCWGFTAASGTRTEPGQCHELLTQMLFHKDVKCTRRGDLPKPGNWSRPSMVWKMV